MLIARPPTMAFAARPLLRRMTRIDSKPTLMLASLCSQIVCDMIAVLQQVPRRITLDSATEEPLVQMDGEVPPGAAQGLLMPGIVY